jgi:hypothetical protein
MTNNFPTPFSEEKQSHDIMIEKAKLLAHSDLLPPAFQKKPANILVALDIAKELGLNPLMVMQNIYIIHGKPSFSSSFILALLHRSQDYRSIDFQFEDEDKKCRVVATKKDGVVSKGPWISLEIARLEGWLSKPGSKWKTMPDLMLRYRAATFFCRTCAPHLLFGFQSSDEVMDIAKDSNSNTSSFVAPSFEKEQARKKKELAKARKTIQDILGDTEYDD